MLGVCLLPSLALLVPLLGVCAVAGRADTAVGLVTAHGHGGAVCLLCAAKDKGSSVCQTETGQGVTSTGGCKHNGQGEHKPSTPSAEIRRVKGEREAPSVGNFSQTEGRI